MFLSRDEERILKGEDGWVLARALRLLVTLGELEGADRLITIRKSQVAGVSYKLVGDATLELLNSLHQKEINTRAATFATQNPAGMDLDRWSEMGISSEFAEKQLQMCAAYEKLGIKPYCTCTPYLSGNCPYRNEIVGFSESSAVAYVNSVIGARTNRHGGLDALSAALVGKVPLMGYLIDEKRKGDIKIKVNYIPKYESDYAALGYQVGKLIQTNEVPVYDGLHHINTEQLKLMGAASAASGSVALFHVIGVTPEVNDWKHKYKDNTPSDIIEIGRREIQSTYEELSAFTDVDLVALGCPHSSLREIEQITQLLHGREIKRGIRFWIFTSPKIYHLAELKGYIQTIRASGADIFKQTCMVVMPIEDLGIECVAVNSAKAAFYIPRITGNRCQAVLKPLKEMKQYLK